MRNIERTDTDPYDIPENKEIDFDVEVFYTMNRKTILSTKDYIKETWCDEERDYDGYIVRNGGVETNTDNVDWVEEFSEQEYSPILLLKEYQGIIYKQIDELKSQEQTREVKAKINNLREKALACDWDFDYIEINEV